MLSLLGVVSSLTVRSFADDGYLTRSPDKLFPVSYITYWKEDNNWVRKLYQHITKNSFIVNEVFEIFLPKYRFVSTLEV